jgi:hypothetical protein
MQNLETFAQKYGLDLVLKKTKVNLNWAKTSQIWSPCYAATRSFLTIEILGATPEEEC